ncbi:MAG: 3'-5' exonuclease [Xanthomonadales bacterium]|jgi:DNA polymerase-3 subunit epsilon|nr:3'-5' exonuclease [Xanthomonadales bacterium]
MLGRWRTRRRLDKARAACEQETLARWFDSMASLAIGTLKETPILSVDLELTGLDPQSAEIVSLGWTAIEGGRIRLGSNRHLLVRSTGGVGTSATIHELRDQDVATGVAEGEALEELFSCAAGHVMLFHHAGLDVPCLQRACETWAGCRPPLPALDTLRWEAERLARRGKTPRDGGLRLGALRERYHLPDHALHDALGDAIATAELFLAMAAHADSRGRLDLGSLVRWL